MCTGDNHVAHKRMTLVSSHVDGQPVTLQSRPDEAQDNRGVKLDGGFGLGGAPSQTRL